MLTVSIYDGKKKKSREEINKKLAQNNSEATVEWDTMQLAKQNNLYQHIY